MVEESRVGLIQKKPRIVLDKRMAFSNDLNIGDKGFIEAIVSVETLRLEMDSEGNEKVVGNLLIERAELADKKERKI